MASNRRRRRRRRKIKHEDYESTSKVKLPKAKTPKIKPQKESLQQLGKLTPSTETIPLDNLSNLIEQEQSETLPLSLPTPEEALKTLEQITQTAPEVEAEQAQDYFNQIPQDQAEEIPTIDFGREAIDMFLYTLNRIYNDTVDKYSNPDTAELYICSICLPELEETYNAIVNEINKMIETGVPSEIIGQAIADNVELYYAIALEFFPPSNCVNHFEVTLEELQGVWEQINREIDKRIDEMEQNFE